MEKIRIITDSASDISFEDEKKYNIGMLNFDVIIGGRSYVSRVDFDNEGFYRLMKEHDDLPKTSQVTPYRFQELYLQEAEAGYTDLILILINSKGSATHGNAVMAKDMFFDEYPEYQGKVRITVYDGIGYSSLYGYPAVNAAKMAAEGCSAAEICAYLDEELVSRQIYFGIYTLKYAGKSGRIPSAAAFIGDKLNLKPVMKICDNAITTASKVRGEAKLVEKVASMAVKDMKPGTPYQIIYGNRAEDAEEIAAVMTKKVGYAPDARYQIGAAVAANAGPRVCGISFKVNK